MSVHYMKMSDLRNVAKFLSRDMVLFTLGFLPFLGLSFWYNFYRLESFTRQDFR
jgi:hypothetical protein